ncbi:hypothetical protein DSO57_1033078 [Entomophthora muscae]|uniref:Uncharacterized protein n=1 Tax=Entomophthora muscae TaxID=34485 RepID=A0ACC2UK45_9FUNG|nr:hypothetical protein DSO57_1033078 [Entomophthora muscae]
MKLLYVCCVLATWNPVEVSNAIKVYDVDRLLMLRRYMKWASGKNFIKYHYNTERLNREKVCHSVRGFIYTKSHCFEKTMQRYLIDEAEYVGELVTSESENVNVVTPKVNLTKEIVSEYPIPINLNESLNFIVPTVPRGFSYAYQATSNSNVSFTFQGKGFTFITFRLIYLVVNGVYTYNYDGLFYSSNEAAYNSFNIPVTLPDGSLDGIYELVGVYNRSTFA